MSRAKRPLIPLDKFPPHLHKFIDPEAGSSVAKLVLQGLVPTEGTIKVCALYQVAHLHGDLYHSAGETLRSLPDETVILALQALPPPLLDWIAETSGESENIAAELLALPQTAKSTLMRLLTSATSAVATRLSVNQTKLLSDSLLLQSLCLNPALDPTIRGSLIELARYQGHDLSWLPEARATKQVDLASPATVIDPPPTLKDPPPTIVQQPPTLKDQPPTLKLKSAAPHEAPPTLKDSPAQKSRLGKPHPFSLVGDEIRAPEPVRLAHDPLPESIFPPQVHKIVAPDAPEAVLNLVFGGLLPMSLEIRVYALYQIAVCRPNFAQRSVEVIRSMDTDTQRDIIVNIKQANVLDWIADHLLAADAHPSLPAIDGHPELVSAMTLNPATRMETLVRLALFTSSAGCERIGNNQQRLSQVPQVIQALYYNPQFSTVQADRILEFAAREGLDLSWLPVANEVLEELGTNVIPPDDHAFAEALAQGEEQDDADATINAVLQEHAARRASQVEENDGKPKKGLALIQSLNVAQKIRLALLGSQSDRALLVRDSNKVVSRAAIRSPAVSVSEALLYARNHSLNAELVEFIAKNRKWMQNYRVKVQVVLNPKTPVNIALSALGSLRPAELRQVAQSHGISGVVSARAKAMIKQRQG